jgi:CoA:oxalate CoA-transferase
MPGPLSGIRVLDFTFYQQGPYATVMLSDMGAEIIKVEPPGRGDPGRGGVAQRGNRSYFIAHDRGKKSITLDLKHPKGRAIALQLAERCDVAVHNFRQGVMERLGLGYEDLRAVNPRIIYAAASGFGPLGPMRQKPGFDIVGQALGGIMSVTGSEVAMPAGAAIGDQVGAMVLAYGIVCALLGRELHGIGQAVDVSLYGSQIALQSWEITQASLTGVLPPRAGRGHPLIGGLWGTYDTADGSLVIGGVGEARWPGFVRALGMEEAMADPRFATREARAEHQAELLETVRKRFRERATREWIAALEAEDIPCAPVQNYLDVLNDEQALANGYITTLDHPERGRIKIVGSPVQMSVTPVGPQSPPPELGQHTEELLLELGYTWEQIAALRAEGVI